jgi:hypothetical protein
VWCWRLLKRSPERLHQLRKRIWKRYATVEGPASRFRSFLLTPSTLVMGCAVQTSSGGRAKLWEKRCAQSDCVTRDQGDCPFIAASGPMTANLPQMLPTLRAYRSEKPFEWVVSLHKLTAHQSGHMTSSTGEGLRQRTRLNAYASMVCASRPPPAVLKVDRREGCATEFESCRPPYP